MTSFHYHIIPLKIFIQSTRTPVSFSTTLKTVVVSFILAHLRSLIKATRGQYFNPRVLVQKCTIICYVIICVYDLSVCAECVDFSRRCIIFCKYIVESLSNTTKWSDKQKYSRQTNKTDDILRSIYGNRRTKKLQFKFMLCVTQL